MFSSLFSTNKNKTTEEIPLPIESEGSHGLRDGWENPKLKGRENESPKEIFSQGANWVCKIKQKEKRMKIKIKI